MTGGAENGTRTRDPQLGKLMLYQLSYFRVLKTMRKYKKKFLDATNNARLLRPFFFIEQIAVQRLDPGLADFFGYQGRQLLGASFS